MPARYHEKKYFVFVALMKCDSNMNCSHILDFESRPKVLQNSLFMLK
jgi:hypothetical protein